MEISQKLKKWLYHTFSIDARTLSLFRIVLSTVILIDLFGRFFSLGVHYTDQGVLPRIALLNSSQYHTFWSFHHFHGSYFSQLILLLILAFFSGLMLIGFRTRLSTIIVWLLLISLMNRNPLILTGGDTILRVLLFWSIFLPLGERFSIDSLRHFSRENRKEKVFSCATIILFLQVILIYLFAWMNKTGQEWWPDGTAVYYALNLEYLTTPLGRIIRKSPDWFLRSLTFCVYWAEFLVVVLFFLKRYRHFLFGLLLVLHICFGLHLKIGLFPLAGIATAVVFFPNHFWEKMTPYLKFLKEKYNDLFLKIASFFQSRFSAPSKKFVLTKVECLLISILFLGVVLLNLGTVKRFNYDPPDAIKSLMSVVRLNQSWSMFAPRPSVNAGWYVVSGRVRNNNEIDLLHEGRPVTGDRPKDMAGMFQNYRWRKYLMNIGKRNFSRYRRYYADYLCREWNKNHQGELTLETVSIDFIQQKTLLNHEKSDPKKLTLLRDYKCKVEIETP